MTVAVACAFQHGVLFCVDSQLTTGEEKAQGSKMYARAWGEEITNGLTVFTLAGMVDYAVAAIEKCEQAISKLNFNLTSLDEMEHAIEVALLEFYGMHVFPRPDPSDVRFQLLIGLWLNGEPRTLSTVDTILKPLRGYECIGDGGYIARYCLQELLGSASKFNPETLTLEEASLITEHAIRSAADYVESCGGEIEFIGMRNTGEVNEIGDIRGGAYLGNFPYALRTATWGLLRQLAKCEDALEQELAVEDFCDEVRSLHKPVIGFLKETERLRATARAPSQGESGSVP